MQPQPRSEKGGPAAQAKARARTPVQPLPAAQPLFFPQRSPLGPGGARAAAAGGDPTGNGGAAPPVVGEVLRSPGHPLDPGTRAFLEPRLGADLSAIRLHTDALAAASARAVNARAYTVGQQIAFARGQYAPGTRAGRRLLLHELTHTLQQQGAPPPRGDQPLEIGPASDRWEAEADAVASSLDTGPAAPPSPTRGGVALRLQRQQPSGGQQAVQPPAGAQPAAAAGASPYTTILPGYSQQGDTCGAASVVTALLVWDREHWDPAQPNSRVVNACNLILAEFARYGQQSVDRWAANPAPEVRRICSGDADCNRQAYDIVRGRFVTDLERIRDASRRPGASVSQADYQKLGLALYFLWNEGGRSGLSSSQIRQIQRTLGLELTAPGASSNITSFDEIFTHPIVSSLQRDQFAQVAWLTNTGAHHVFLVGQLQSGEWFLSDQGPSPAAEFRAPSLTMLGSTVRAAAVSGSYWLFVGTHADFMRRGGGLPGWTGVTRLAPSTAVGAQAQNVVALGAFLGEVDAGYFTTGSRITRGAFVAVRYTLADAQAAFPASTAGGGLIVELPRGVFTLYTTSAASDANLSQTSLDVSDSAGGVLVGRSVLHAWLILGTGSGRHGSWFRVF